MEAEVMIWIYMLILSACAFLIYGRAFIPLPKSAHAPLPASFLGFQRKFLCVHILASVVEQLQVLNTEEAYKKFGVDRKTMATMLAMGFFSSLFFGTFLGLSVEYIGRKRMTMFCLLLHVFVAVCKQAKSSQMLYCAILILAPAVAVFPCAFEAWMVAEHERATFVQEWLSDTFWVMSFGSAVVGIATGAFANLMFQFRDFGITSTATIAAIVASFCLLLMVLRWKDRSDFPRTTWTKSTSLVMSSFYDKKIFLLGCIHACIEFTIWTFWFLWIPTLVADGREVNGGLIFSLLMASRMLGSILASFYLCGPFSARAETYLPLILIVSSVCMVIPAYDYQEVGVLVAVFCLFQLCMGIVLPSLSYLRSIYMQANCRAGIMTLYHAPVNIALIIIVTYGAKYHKLENDMIFALCTCCLLSAASGLYIMDQWRIKIQGRYSSKKPKEHSHRTI